MIQNPDYSHARILSQVLSEENTKIKARIQHTSCLQLRTSQLQRQIEYQKHQAKKKHLNLVKSREAALVELETANRKRANLVKQVNNSIKCHRQLSSGLPFLRRSVSALEMEQEEHLNEEASIDGQTSEIEELLKSELRQLEKQQKQLSTLKQQHKIGQTRVRIQRQQLQSLQVQMSTMSSSIEEAKFMIRQGLIQIEELKDSAERVEERRYELRLSCMEIQNIREELGEKALSITEEMGKMEQKIVKATISSQSQNEKVLEFQDKITKKRQVCHQVESDLLLRKSEAGSLSRDNKLLEHKIDCTHLLMNIFRECTDRLAAKPDILAAKQPAS